MTSSYSYNTRSKSKETRDSKIIHEISKLRIELVEDFLKSFIVNNDEIVNLKEVIIRNLQNENKRVNDAVNQLQEKIISLKSKNSSI